LIIFVYIILDNVLKTITFYRVYGNVTIPLCEYSGSIIMDEPILIWTSATGEKTKYRKIT